jgi:hypothetical protein
MHAECVFAADQVDLFVGRHLLDQSGYARLNRRVERALKVWSTLGECGWDDQKQYSGCCLRTKVQAKAHSQLPGLLKHVEFRTVVEYRTKRAIVPTCFTKAARN